MKVAYNVCYGGFKLSEEAENLLRIRGYNGNIHSLRRHDPILVGVIEELGDKASARDPDNYIYSKIKLAESNDASGLVIYKKKLGKKYNFTTLDFEDGRQVSCLEASNEDVLTWFSELKARLEIKHPIEKIIRHTKTQNEIRTHNITQNAEGQYQCPCGSVIRYQSIKSHINTKKHRDFARG